MQNSTPEERFFFLNLLPYLHKYKQILTNTKYKTLNHRNQNKKWFTAETIDNKNNRQLPPIFINVRRIIRAKYLLI